MPQRGAVSVNDIYPLAEFQDLTGLTDSAMRSARRRGLRVRRCGKRAFVWGQDFLDYLLAESDP